MGPERSGFFLCLVGPAGSGKTSIAAALLKEHEKTLQRSISVTSRSPRPEEVPGKSYVFVSPEEFKAKVEADEFFEWEQVHGNFYGTLRETLSLAERGGYDLLFDIDIRGALSLKREFGESVVSVFVAPSSPGVLADRIKQRGGVADGELERRMHTAAAEYSKLKELHAAGHPLDYLVINDSLPVAIQQVNSIIQAERARLRRLSKAALSRYLSSGEAGGE